MAVVLYIGADNSVILDELKNSTTGLFVNSGATVTFTLYRRVATDVVTTASSTTITSAVAPFVSGDAGRKVVVRYAGTNGADLRTTISTFTSSSAVVLASAPSVSTTKAECRMSVASATTVTMSYVTDSNGKYRGTIDDSVELKDSEPYWIEISADAGSDVIDFRVIDAVARYRE